MHVQDVVQDVPFQQQPRKPLQEVKMSYFLD